MCKAFGLTPGYVLHGISYANLHMMAVTLPSPDGEGKANGQTPDTAGRQTLNGDDPATWQKVKELQKRMNS